MTYVNIDMTCLPLFHSPFWFFLGIRQWRGVLFPLGFWVEKVDNLNSLLNCISTGAF